MGKSMQNVVSRSGRFSEGPAQIVAEFTESISFDYQLAQADIAGSKAHAEMIHSLGILSEEENRAIQTNLDEIAREIAEGTFVWRPEHEDVHMNIESELTRRTPAGAKLHTGRSRNDQVAVSMRLWQRGAMQSLGESLLKVQKSLLALAQAHSDVIIPGYTHLQRAQPVYFAHHLMAYMEMFDRDYERLGDAYKRVNVCPLGAGALAGSTLPLDREKVALLLGFVDPEGRPRVSRNSMDAVSDRDFMVELCGICSLIAVHLSRLSEDFILWSSSEFDFIRVSDAFTTGSSLMPQKKNLDVAELSRGKTGRVVGNLMALLTLLKGLPMTYNRDLQEDKERLFDSFKTVRLTLEIWAAMLREVTLKKERCRRAASDPALLATDLVDYLVRKGVAFRLGHHAVGELVAMAEKKGVLLNELSLEEFRQVNPLFEADILETFQLEKAMSKKTCVGSGGTQPMNAEFAHWQERLGAYSIGCERP